ncbi:MAG: PilW family protein [Endozoicomonas sp.]
MRSRGFTFIEVMVALLMGSLIMATFLKVLLNNIQMSRYNEYQLSAQQNIRKATFILTSDIRMAGARDPANGSVADPFLTSGCGTLTSCTSEGGGTVSDTIAVQFEPPGGADCTGNTVAAGELNVNYYYIATDSSLAPNVDNVSGLFCRGYNPSTGAWRGLGQLMVAGVHNLQVLYGYADTAGSDPVTSYRTATSVSDWSQVRSVQIGMLVSGGDTPGVVTSRVRSYDLMGSGTIVFADGKPRYAFTSVSSIFSTRSGLGNERLWVD